VKELKVKEFSVIIPSRNPGNLIPCVKAIRAAGERCRIIVIADFRTTTDEVAACEALQYGRVEFVHGVKPFCFARNMNIGIRCAGDDDVILLNDDTLLETPRGFTALHRRSFDPAYGIIASSCSTVGNTNQWQKSPPMPGLRDEPRMVCFVCVLIPRRTLLAVGDLDERFVDYGLDDDDYCLRVRKQGGKIGIFDGCFVDHGTLTSSYRAPAEANSAPGDFRPNLRRFIEKWGVDNWGRTKEESRRPELF